MVFIPSTYTRAAGIQSEIGKTTVNKIAHLENDYRRMVYMAKVDMKKTMREIKHNRAVMKRSRNHYTKKLRDYKAAKEKRYFANLGFIHKYHYDEDPTSAEINDAKHERPQKDVQENDQSAKMFVSEAVQDISSSTTNNNHTTNQQVRNNIDFQHGSVETKSDAADSPERNTSGAEGKLIKSIEAVETQKHSATHSLPPGNNDDDKAVKISPLEDNGKTKNQIHATGKEITSDESTESDQHKNCRIPKRRRTGLVNHVNIMRLRYSTNIKALFSAVDALAKVHAGSDFIEVDTSEMSMTLESGPRRVSQTQPMATAKAPETRRISQVSEPRRLSQVSDSRRSSQVSDSRRISVVSNKGLMCRDPETRTVGPRRLSQSSGSRKISQGSKTSHRSEDPTVLPSEYLYNMKYGYAIPEFEVSGLEATHQDSTNAHLKDNEHFLPALKVKSSKDIAITKQLRKLSVNSTHSPRKELRPVSNSSTFSETDGTLVLPPVRQRKSVVSAVRASAEIPTVAQAQPYADDYFEHIEDDHGDSVAWQTAFGMLKHVHFIDTKNL